MAKNSKHKRSPSSSRSSSSSSRSSRRSSSRSRSSRLPRRSGTPQFSNRPQSRESHTVSSNRAENPQPHPVISVGSEGCEAHTVSANTSFSRQQRQRTNSQQTYNELFENRLRNLEDSDQRIAETSEALLAFRSHPDDKLLSLEENLTKQTAARVTKKLKLSNVELNYKGNQRQFQFNLEQKEKLEEALDSIRNTAAKSLVKEGIEALGKRNKLIRLADRSEAGWRALEEYIAIEDVPDSDDDRKMRQAEQRAIRKKEAKKQPLRVYNNPVTGPVQHQYIMNNRKDQIFVPTDRINLASKPVFSNSRIPQDSPVTFVDNQVTGKPPVLIDKGLFSHSTLSFNQRKCISQQKDSKFCQEKPKTHEESLQVKYNNLRSDFNTNNSDCLITRVVLGNTSCGSDNESYDHEQDSKNAFIKGSLRSNFEYWKEIGASDFILDVIENGYKLPFRTISDKAEF